jgi:hypothetical protein
MAALAFAAMFKMFFRLLCWLRAGFLEVFGKLSGTAP